MKKIFLLCLLLSTLGCTHYFVRESSWYELYELTKEELDFLKSKKVGLIGFYPFVTETKLISVWGILNRTSEITNPKHLQIIKFLNDDTKGRRLVSFKTDNFIRYKQTRTQILKINTTLNESENLIQFLEFGRNSKELKVGEKNISTSPEKLRDFLYTYLWHTESLGLDEIENLLIIPEQKGKNIQMKDFDVDYWVINICRTSFETISSNKGDFTLFPFLITLGTFPLWEEEKVSSKFVVFDNQLNQIKTIETKSIHNSFTAWWAIGGSDSNNPVSPSAKFYKPNLQELSKRLVQVFKK